MTLCSCRLGQKAEEQTLEFLQLATGLVFFTRTFYTFVAFQRSGAFLSELASNIESCSIGVPIIYLIVILLGKNPFTWDYSYVSNLLECSVWLLGTSGKHFFLACSWAILYLHHWVCRLVEASKKQKFHCRDLSAYFSEFHHTPILKNFISIARLEPLLVPGSERL